MPNPMNAATYVVHELRAREAWSKRDYRLALDYAKQAAGSATDSHDLAAWWNMTYLQAECLRELNAYKECAGLARTLLNHPLSTQLQPLDARASTLLAVALQGIGHLPEAIETAAAAVAKASSDEQIGSHKIEAQHAYIAALAESGDVDEAWAQCLELDSAVTDQVDDQTCGKAYWVIGNVAFLRHQASEGLRYHSLASRMLSPTNDVDLWAKFNKASAAMRLSAGILEPETLECIERAELAMQVVEAGARERLQLSVVRAHWLYSTGDARTAVELLRVVCRQLDLLSAQSGGDALLLLGKSLLSCDENEEAITHIRMAAELYARAGAGEKATVAVAILEERQG